MPTPGVLSTRRPPLCPVTMPRVAASPSPPARELGAEEGVEDAGQRRTSPCRSRHPTPPARRRALPGEPRRECARCPVGGRHTRSRRCAGSRCPATAADGLGCIDDQVHQHLLYLPGVGLDQGQPSGNSVTSRTFLGTATSSRRRFSSINAFSSRAAPGSGRARNRPAADA